MDYQQPKEDDNENMHEPPVAYSVTPPGRMRFFTSFQQQEDEMISYWASITPLQRLKHLHEMIVHSFGLTDEQLKNPRLSNRLTIVSYEP